MEIIWYALLGLFFGTYLVLGGLDYGVGLLLAGENDPVRRRRALTALGPFFLGNEVWLVASLGILFGAFPMLEGELLTALYPAVALALAGVVLVTVGVQLRSRPTGGRARVGWDRVVVTGSTLAALGWGAVLAGLLQGVPLDAERHVVGLAHLRTPFVAAAGLAVVALVAVHGAAFLALRLPARPHLPSNQPGQPGQSDQPGESGQPGQSGQSSRSGQPGEPESPAGEAGRLGRRLVPVALVAVGAATVVGLLSTEVRAGVRQPLPAVLLPILLVAALLLARAALARRRPGLALTATGAALALPVLLIAAANWPYALVSTVDPDASLTVAEAAASPPTLRLLGWLTLPLLPALLGFQVMCWWVFRGRTDGRAPVYW